MVELAWQCCALIVSYKSQLGRSDNIQYIDAVKGVLGVLYPYPVAFPCSMIDFFADDPRWTVGVTHFEKDLAASAPRL